ncbi:MAG: hemerythrin domain-containing protein [Candidatus Krumholzibacteriia bacterium]
MKLTDVIRRDHERFRTALEGILRHAENDREEAGRQFDELARDIHAHHEGEEQVWLPRFDDDAEARAEALEYVEEHDVLQDLMEKLRGADPTNERWLPRLRVFREILLHHIDEEEDEGFALADELIEELELERLGAEFDQRTRDMLRRARSAEA